MTQEENTTQQPIENTAQNIVGGEKIAHETTLFAEPVIHYKNFTITNALLTSWIVVIVIIIMSYILRSKLKETPGRIQNFFEVIISVSTFNTIVFV